MNWFMFGLAAWLSMGLERGFRPALKLGGGDIAPYFPVVLVAFVALWAPAPQALLGAVVVGVVWDVLSPVAVADGGSVVVVGPHALGLGLAAYTVVTVRGVMLRKNVLTLAMLAGLGGALTQLVAVSLLVVRSLYDEVVFPSALGALGGRLGSAVYTALLAALLTPVLGFVRPLFSFRPIGGSGFRAP